MYSYCLIFEKRDRVTKFICKSVDSDTDRIAISIGDHKNQFSYSVTSFNHQTIPCDKGYQQREAHNDVALSIDTTWGSNSSDTGGSSPDAKSGTSNRKRTEKKKLALEDFMLSVLG